MGFKPLLILALLMALPTAGCDAEPSAQPLAVTGKDQAVHHFTVEIADEPDEQRQGLMGRQDLAADRGMLFIFPKEHPATFWMKNTPLFLDMVFINDSGVVVHIHPMARPFDETLITTPVPARAVLEIKGGEAERRNITPGSSITPAW